jgi:hypothetical protein
MARCPTCLPAGPLWPWQVRRLAVTTSSEPMAEGAWQDRVGEGTFSRSERQRHRGPDSDRLARQIRHGPLFQGQGRAHGCVLACERPEARRLYETEAISLDSGGLQYGSFSRRTAGAFHFDGKGPAGFLHGSFEHWPGWLKKASGVKGRCDPRHAEQPCRCLNHDPWLRPV